MYGVPRLWSITWVSYDSISIKVKVSCTPRSFNELALTCRYMFKGSDIHHYGLKRIHNWTASMLRNGRITLLSSADMRIAHMGCS